MWTVRLSAEAKEAGKVRFFIDSVLDGEENVTAPGTITHQYKPIEQDGNYSFTVSPVDSGGIEGTPSDPLVQPLQHVDQLDMPKLVSAVYTP